MYTLYKIVNTASGTVYYGITKNLRARWSAHRNSAKRGLKSPVYDAMRSYGIDKFEIEVIEDNLTRQEACDKEVELIADPTVKKYNLHCGGDIGFSMRTKAPEVYEEWKSKLRKARKGRKPAAGMKHSEENKELFRKVSREYWDTQQTYSKEVLSLPFCQANRKYGISRTHYYRLRKRLVVSDNE